MPYRNTVCVTRIADDNQGVRENSATHGCGPELRINQAEVRPFSKRPRVQQGPPLLGTMLLD